MAKRLRFRAWRRRASLRPMLPQLYVSWENGYEVVIEVYWLGSLNPNVSESLLAIAAIFDLPPRFGEWLLPHYNRWAERTNWIA